jgi:CheY-like chemotaxis protein
MPGMSGIEFHDELRARAPELLGSILFVTGDVASHDVAAFGQRVDADILAKPFVAEELMRRLNDIVAQARSHSDT